jgi:hypothetical protein
MQRDEVTKKVEQIRKVAQNPEQITQNIYDVSCKFEVRDILKNLDVLKRSGALLSTIHMTLLVLPFIGVASVGELFKSRLVKDGEGKKDAYYGAKNNEKINWRMLLISIARRFIQLVSKDKEALLEMEKAITAIILDDRANQQTGKSIEGIGYVYDHVTNTHILGYKLLVCGFWDGRSFIPIDFSIHKEKRDTELKKVEEQVQKTNNKIKAAEKEVKEVKTQIQECEAQLKETKAKYASNKGKTNKTNMERKQRKLDRAQAGLLKAKDRLNTLKEKATGLANTLFDLKANHHFCGLSKKDFKNQYKKSRDRNTPGYKRKNETSQSKNDNAIKMLKRAIRSGFVPDYVLTDSWFFCHKLLQAIIEIGRGVHLISMAKIGTAKYTLLPNGDILNPHQIITKYERKQGKNSRKYKSRYIQFQASYQGTRVKIFLVKFGRNNNWRMLVSTDLNITFTKIMDTYAIRWSIEIFFRECKQNLQLGKCQSNDFDAQIADATLSMIRYILLSYCERIRYGITIGGLFKELSQAAIKENLLVGLHGYFFELLKLFAEIASVDFIGFYEELLRNPRSEKLLTAIGLNQNKTPFFNVA